MTDPIIKKLRTLVARKGRTASTKVLVPAALVLALMTSGCDKCGDYFWYGGAKSCHDDSQVK